MKRAALWLCLLCGCEADPEGVRWLPSRSASYALEPPAKLHVVSAFLSADGVKVSGREGIRFCALVRHPDTGARQRLLTEHGAADTSYTHLWGSKSLRYAWDRQQDRLLAEGRSFPFAKGRLFVFTAKDEGWEILQAEGPLDELTPALFKDGTGMESLLSALEKALGEGAPTYGFPKD